MNKQNNYDSFKYKLPISKRTYLKFKQKNEETIKTLREKNKALKKENKRMAYLIEMMTPESKYEEYLCAWFAKTTGARLNLKNPKSFNEKVQWLKLYANSPLRTQLADKYLVRDYVTEKVGEEYLPKLLGVYEDFDEINFSELPDKFALKANHGCGYNEIITDKNTIDTVELRKKVDQWLSENYAYRNGLELQYRDIHPRIIVEEYLQNEGDDLYDYKIYCFNGNAKYIMFMKERNEGIKAAVFDTEWNKQEFVSNHEPMEEDVEKPKNLEKALKLAETLSQGFPLVRVDFYILNDGTIKFGEMTFTPASGGMTWNPPEYNNILGDLIEL